MMNWSKGGPGSGVVTVTVPDKASLLTDIGERLENREGFSVATLNLDHAVKLSRDPAFREAYSAQSHITADGNPVVWLSHLAGQTEVELAPGSEVIEPIARLAASKSIPVALFGATDDSLHAAADALRRSIPSIDIALTLSPPMGFDPMGTLADDAISQIDKSGARLVFLALGAPKQECFAARAQGTLPTVGFLSIGAGLDFISGTQKRAPRWVRALAAEWLWRMLGNPRRLANRYLACLVALPRLMLIAIRTRLQTRRLS